MTWNKKNHKSNPKILWPIKNTQRSVFRAKPGLDGARKPFLSLAYLSGANLINATLIQADLYKADLSGANLTQADLRKANPARQTCTKLFSSIRV